MRPVLFHLGGIAVTSYGLSKALAGLVAGWLLARELRRVGRDPSLAYPLTVAALVAGFAGAKLNYLLENAGHLGSAGLGGTGFTWYGGMIGGAAAVLVIAHRHGIPTRLIAGISAAPLAFGYAIGRIGCLLAGDGTYGKPSDLPWAMSFPDGTVPTLQRVQPTPLYEAIAAFRDRAGPLAAAEAALTGAVVCRLRGEHGGDALPGRVPAAELPCLPRADRGAALVARPNRARWPAGPVGARTAPVRLLAGAGRTRCFRGGFGLTYADASRSHQAPASAPRARGAGDGASLEPRIGNGARRPHRAQ
jgi:hypothetical protein